MTEKEKRELKDGVISIFKRFNILDHTATIGGLRDDILRYINSLQKEPANEKKCMFTKDNYTDEDRMVLCEDCKEKCEYSKKEEPVSESIDFEQELYKAFGQIKDFTLGIAIAKRFYDMGRKHNEPVSEELEKAAVEAFKEIVNDERNSFLEIFKAGAKWQEDKDKQTLNEEGVVVLPEEEFERMKRSLIELAEKEQQMIKDATEVTVHIDAGGYPYIPQMELYDYDKDVPLAKEGDKYKVILIKED